MIPQLDEIVDTEGVPIDVVDDNATTLVQVSEGRELVRVGRIPQLNFVDGRWEVPQWGLVFEDMWNRLEDFQAPMPPLPPNFPVRLIAEGLRDTTKWNEVPYAKEIDRKIRLNPDASVRWEFDLLNRDKTTWHLDTAIMGEQRFVRWTWGDANVVAPLLRAISSVANFFYPLFVRKIRYTIS